MTQVVRALNMETELRHDVQGAMGQRSPSQHILSGHISNQGLLPRLEKQRNM